MYDTGHIFSENSYTHLYFDLRQLYRLGFIRSYNTTDAYNFSLTTNTYYSSDDIDDVNSLTWGADHSDAVRWLRVDMLNGDGTDRVVRKVTVLPDIRYNIVGDHYNCEWEDLGYSITDYGRGDNVALNKTITSSSEYSNNYTADMVIDGFLGDAFNESWLSDNNTTQWLKIDLGSEYSIYRIKMYHGYAEAVYTHYIDYYEISVSTDDDEYTEIFDIDANSDLERTHDLADPVTARYILINISSFIAPSPVYLDKGDGVYGYFEGAVLREIEVYSDYGYQLVNSEEWPVIAVNLRSQFYISGAELVGDNAESSSNDWDDSTQHYTYSDSVTDDPNNVIFGDWGDLPGYEKWVVVKEYAATQYESGPKYLKHLIVNGTYDENPCEYYWWWRSSLSTLSNDHMYVKNARRSLKISYPTSSGVDDVSFIEGDNFGVDSYAGMRDGVTFWIHIDDINNLDITYGYFYFGNIDTPVKYKWNISTLHTNGDLNSGWNQMFLRFMDYDEIEYTPSIDFTAVDVRIPETIDWKTIGVNFRGVGNSFNMRIDGFEIFKNHFRDECFDDTGLYLIQRDVMTAHISELSLSKGTIEFFMRPDYDPNGLGDFNSLKNRSLFVMSNVAQDFLGATIVDENLVVYFGNLNDDLLIFETEITGYWNIRDVVHIAITWSNNGTEISSDGSTVRVYVYGELQSKMFDTWDVNDDKKINFYLGGRPPFSIVQNYGAEISSIDAVVGHLRLYNYCKTNFDDTIYNVNINPEPLTDPSQFVEISKDNLTFYKVGDPNLPLFWENVSSNMVVPIYVRTVLPRTLTGKELRTANIIAYWDVGV